MSVLLRRYYQLLNNRSLLSDETMQAIMQDFGEAMGSDIIKAFNAYLISIKDKTEMNTIIDLVNEDPMLVCSLDLGVAGMPIRWLVGDGLAYIMTNIIISSASVFSVRFKNKRSLSNYPKVFGAYTSWNAADAFHLGMPSNGSGKVALWESGGDWPNCNADIYTALDQDIEITNCTVAGFDAVNHTLGIAARANSGKTSITGSKPIRIFGANGTWPYGEQNWPWCIEHFGHKNGNNRELLLPFIRNAAINGMIDTLTGTFYPNANSSGSFTIAYTLPDGTPWTPGT